MSEQTMIERVAEAVFDTGMLLEADECREIARAAIGAMRDATDEMLESGGDTGPIGCCNMTAEDVEDVWFAMIDAALSDHATTEGE